MLTRESFEELVSMCDSRYLLQGKHYLPTELKNLSEGSMNINKHIEKEIPITAFDWEHNDIKDRKDMYTKSRRRKDRKRKYRGKDIQSTNKRPRSSSSAGRSSSPAGRSSFQEHESTSSHGLQAQSKINVCVCCSGLNHRGKDCLVYKTFTKIKCIHCQYFHESSQCNKK